MNNFQILVSEPSDGALLLDLSGELDLATVKPLQDASRAATASGDYKLVVFDLTHLDFMDSTGLHVLAQSHQAMAASGGEVKVVCSSANLLRVFELTGLVGTLTIVEDRASALAGSVVAA